MSINVITIDGPSGVGKGTLGAKLAAELGWHFLDSGAIYRVLGYSLKKNNIEENNIGKIVENALELPVIFVEGKILLGDDDVSAVIRTEEVGSIASRISVHKEVREALLQMQRNFLKAPGLVADGRDMGTIVFPDAKLKIFLDASVEERAKRRFYQLKKKGQNVSLQNLLEEVGKRDQRDKEREVAPLLAATDATHVDTTQLTISEVFEEVKRLANNALVNI